MATDAASAAASLAKINALLDKLDGKGIELQNAINGALKWIPDSWVIGLDKAWNTFVAKWNEFWKEMGRITSNMGNPGSLLNTADEWSSKVGGPVSGTATTGMPGSLLVDDNWTGTAAENYKQKLIKQKEPLTKMQATFSAGIVGALRIAAAGIAAFWAGLVVALVALAVALGAAILTAETVLGAIGFAVAGLVTALGSILSGIFLLEYAMREAETDLRTKINDNNGFDGTKWPEFVTG